MRPVTAVLTAISFFIPAGMCFAQPKESAAYISGMHLYVQGNFQGCVKDLTQAVKASPQKALYWFNLGNCLFMSGDYGKAQYSFKKVRELASPLAPAAMLYQAKALKQRHREAEARQVLQELLRQQPPQGISAEANADLESLGAANTALNLYQQGKYTESETELKKSGADSQSNSQLLLGLTLIKQDKNSEAEQVLKPLLQGPSLSATDQAVVRDLLLQLKNPGLLERPYWLFADFAYGTTSNAYLEGRSYSPISSPLVRASVGGGYRFYHGAHWSQKISYVFDYEDPTKATELLTQTHSLQLPLVFQSSGIELGFVPYVQEQIWDQSPAFRKVGALARSSFRGDKIGGGFDVEVYSQTALSDENSYLSGTSYSVKPFVSFGGASWSSQVYWLLGTDGTHDIVYIDGSRLPLQHSFQGPGGRLLWRFTSNISMLLQILYVERNYKNNSLPEDKHRDDHETISSVKVAYGLAPNWVVYALAEYNPNTSTLGADDVRDKNYNNLNVLAGVGWDVF